MIGNFSNILDTSYYEPLHSYNKQSGLLPISIPSKVYFFMSMTYLCHSMGPCKDLK